jgi:phosphoadenosine phosphosulfate reductase
MTPETPQSPVDGTAIEEVARNLEDAPAVEIIKWGLEAYPSRIVLACSFGGPSGIVILDLTMGMDSSTPVYYLDTGLLFPETHALIDRITTRYGIDPIPVSPALTIEQQNEQFGEALWKRDPDACCDLRKVQPQHVFLSQYDAWISGIRRDQTHTRRLAPVVQWDERFGLVKINPLAKWTEAEVWNYIRKHGLPYNGLHDRGFPSIGCVPCTRALDLNDDLRSGRWPGFTKTECGLHILPHAIRGTVD